MIGLGSDKKAAHSSFLQVLFVTISSWYFPRSCAFGWIFMQSDSFSVQDDMCGRWMVSRWAGTTSLATKRLCGGREGLPHHSWDLLLLLLALHIYLSPFVQAVPGIPATISTSVPSEIFGSVGGGEELRGGLCVLGRGGVGAWLGVGGAERAFRRSRHPVAAAPTLAKLGLPSPGPAASHSAHQSRRMAGRAKPASESRIGSGGSWAGGRGEGGGGGGVGE